jgi:3-hydroxybutyryl-CoA dehydratase
MANPVRQKCIQGLEEGNVFTFERTFTRDDTEAFGDLTRDYNPVHYDTRWTESKGFNGLICHGLLVGSMLCEFGGQVGWLATGMNFNFIRPVYFGDTITCVITITRIEANGRSEAEALFTNETGEMVCRADFSGRLPLSGDQGILKQMTDEGDPTNKLHKKTAYRINQKE